MFSRQDAIKVIFELLDENDALPWPNDTAYQYLQGLAAWLDRLGNDQITWQLLAEGLSAARGSDEAVEQ